jgi:cytochrome c-type biogenesis protein CcmH
LLVPFLAGGLYLWLGQPLQPDRPLAERRATGDLSAASASASPAAQADLAQAVTQLESYLAGHPDAFDGWLLLGRSYQTLDRYRDAERAFGEAYRLAPDRADVAGAYGEAMVVANQGEVTEPALAVLKRAIDADPLNVQARYFYSLGLGQRGQVREAAQGLADLLALSPADAPWRPQVARQLEQAAAELRVEPASIAPSPEVAKLAAQLRAPAADQPGGGDMVVAPAGPSAEDMAAAAQMTAEERRQMVRGMVERLAARLNDNPDDRDGWLRLARAYEVLGEPEKAADARARAEAAAARP